MSADWFIKKPFILALQGTSLTNGRLGGYEWSNRLAQVLQSMPEAVGPIKVENFGKGSQTSTGWGVPMAPAIADFNPTHILTEGFAINDCAIGPVSQPQHITNMQTMHDIYKAKNPNVDITWQTMNGVSVPSDPLRANLAAYYADEVTKAAAMGDRMIDNYANPPFQPPGFAGGWIKPLPVGITYDGDGLHPKWENGTELYLWPNVLYWARCRMAEWWGLPTPNPPNPPPLPDAEYLVVGGGGGGGSYAGGGGGGGRVVYGMGVLTNLLGAVVIGNPGVNGNPFATRGVRGTNGGESSIAAGLIKAPGGGGGGAYPSAVPANEAPGKDGGSGGGAASYVSSWPGGAETPPFSGPAGIGHNGGPSSAGTNEWSGGGGGATQDGQPGTSSPMTGGQGGIGYTVAIPGLGSLTFGAGGPGGCFAGTRPVPLACSYGRGGSGITNGGTPGLDPQIGAAVIWYAGAPRATGGFIVQSGGFTVHLFDGFTASGNLALYSRDFRGGYYYVPVGASVGSAPTQPADPLGGSQATLVTWAVGDRFEYQNDPLFPVGRGFSDSFYAKLDTRDAIRWADTVAGVSFDVNLNTGAVTNIVGAVTPLVTNAGLGAGWWRISASYTYAGPYGLRLSIPGGLVGTMYLFGHQQAATLGAYVDNNTGNPVRLPQALV